MGKSGDEEQNLPGNAGGEVPERDAGRIYSGCGFGWISSFVSLRCVLVLVFSAALFLSALFWLPPFLQLADRRDLDPNSMFKGHEILASFYVDKPVSLLESNTLQLEEDIFDELSNPGTKVIVLSVEPLGRSNITKVVFAIDPDAKDSKLSPEAESLIREAFESFVTNQLSLRLTKSLFGEPFLFEVLKFPGGITVIPLQSAFLLQKVQILFNFTLNFSIYQIQTNFEELASQLKMGLHLAPYENLYVSLSNSKGSTMAPPTTVQSSVVPRVGNTPTMPRLKQLAQTITGSHSKNLGLNNTVFGRVKQVRLSSILQHSLHGGDGSATSWSPSPAPLPEESHHHHYHHHQHHHGYDHYHHNHHYGYLAPEPAPAPASAPAHVKNRHATKGVVLAPAPDNSPSSPWKSCSSSPPCQFRNKRRTRKKSWGKQYSSAPSVAPQHSPASPQYQLHPPVPSPILVSPSIPATSPVPNVVFAHAKPPSRSDSETLHHSKTPSISALPSQSSAGCPTMQWEFILIVVAVILNL